MVAFLKIFGKYNKFSIDDFSGEILCNDSSLAKGLFVFLIVYTATASPHSLIIVW